MKACPNCKYLWPDEHSGQCVECGNPMKDVASNGNHDLQFRFAKQIQDGVRENQSETAMKMSQSPARPGDAYDRAPIPERILDAARTALVQREEVRYDDAT